MSCHFGILILRATSVVCPQKGQEFGSHKPLLIIINFNTTRPKLSPLQPFPLVHRLGSKSPKPAENGQMITLLQSHRSDHLPLHSRDQEISGSEVMNRSDLKIIFSLTCFFFFLVLGLFCFVLFFIKSSSVNLLFPSSAPPMYLPERKQGSFCL